MAFIFKSLTSYFDRCNIQYQIESASDEEGVVSFVYDKVPIFASVGPLPDFKSSLGLILLDVCEVPSSDESRFLKVINRLNDKFDIAKFVFEEKNNTIRIEVVAPLDSNPDLDIIVPGLVNLLLNALDDFLNAIGK